MLQRRRRKNSQVGFQDDTSYLDTHYGGRMGRRRVSFTNSDQNSAQIVETMSKNKVPVQGGTAGSPDGDGSTGLHCGVTRPTSDSHRSRWCPRGTPPCVDALNPGAGIGDGTALKRPNLSEQLASIGKAAEDITSDIRRTHGLKPLQGVILTTPSERFLVGRLRCKYPSPVHFYSHKCLYTFHHPFETTRITMEMFFRDMRDASLEPSRRRLRFKIDHPLCHYKLRDYTHDNPTHFVAVDFSSDHDTQRVANEGGDGDWTLMKSRESKEVLMDLNNTMMRSPIRYGATRGVRSIRGISTL